MPELIIDREFLTETLIDLVRINSVNPSLVPGAPGEGEIAAQVATVVDRLGLRVAIHDAAPGRPSVVGTLPGKGTGRRLMLNGHLDTVDIAGMSDPLGGEVRDGRVYGRGAQDMKGSLAACLAAAKALIDARVPLAGDLVIAAVPDEEHASIGTADVIRRYPVDGAVVTEPTNLQLCVAHKGFAWIEVITQGRAAHGSRFEEGIDANLRMGRFLERLDALERAVRTRPPHALLGPPSLHAATLAGGSGLSTYAARCKLEVERRTVPGESEALVVDELEAIADRLTEEDPTFRATVRSSFWRSPFEAAADSAVVAAVERAATVVLGRTPERIGKSGWMDSSLLAGAGVDTVIFGPTGEGLHGPVEWVDLDSVVQTALVLARTARTYCAAAPRAAG